MSRFVDDILTNASVVDMQRVQQFAQDLEGSMKRAAEMAVKDYFMRFVVIMVRFVDEPAWLMELVGERG